MSVAETNTMAKAMQNCAVAWLEAGAEFHGVPIIGRREKAIVDDIEAALAELGACIYVMPGMPMRFTQMDVPYAERYELRFRCIENAALNTTLPDVFELVEYVVRRMWGRQFPAIEGMNPLMPPEAKPVEEIDGGERRIWDVRFETSVGLLPRTSD